MKVKCNYCGKEIEDTDLVCPYCGAPNENAKRNSSSEPETIEELKRWYKKHHLPPEETTRFFIGKDIKEKRAFGIYKDEDSGDFIVYKNKDNGKRVIRYQGKDEKYAVNEIYQRLKEEISNQKSRNKNSKKTNIPPKKTNRWIHKILKWVGITVAFIAIIMIIVICDSDGYYSYNGTQYYYYDSTWYYYDDTLNDWKQAEDLDEEFIDNYKDYYQSYTYNSDYGAYDFDESYYYITDHNNSNSSDDDDWDDDWDNDSSWSSSDSWDSGSSDWDSDW